MHHIKTFSPENPQREEERHRRAVAVLPEITQEPVGRRRRTETIHANTVNDLVPDLRSSRRANDRNAVTRAGQGQRLPANAVVLWIGLILQEHQHAVIGRLHSYSRLRILIFDRRVFSQAPWHEIICRWLLGSRAFSSGPSRSCSLSRCKIAEVPGWRGASDVPEAITIRFIC